MHTTRGEKRTNESSVAREKNATSKRKRERYVTESECRQHMKTDLKTKNSVNVFCLSRALQGLLRSLPKCKRGPSARRLISEPMQREKLMKKFCDTDEKYWSDLKEIGKQ